MAKIDIPRTELVWPSKYNDDGTRKEVPRVNLPFQVIETINQSRATREADKQRQQTLFNIWEGKEGDTFDAGWTNKLIWGDNLLADRLDLIAQLIAQWAHIYVHLDYRPSHYARVLLDERFGVDAYRNEVAWKRSNPKNDPKQFGRIHDTLLYYAADESEFYPVYGDYREEYVEQAYRHRDSDGRRFRLLPLHATHKLGRWAIHVTRKRLLGIESCKPFEILNLGKYERQYWQGVTFGESSKSVTEQSLYEYLAFILKLYGAQPLAGLAHLHGKQGKAMIHIGSVDAPVTIDEINAAVAECVPLRQTELHVLGWEWEMGLYDLMVAEAKRQGVKLLLLQIPREVMEQQAVDKGDIQSFELAYLEVKIETPKKHTVTVTLADFVIPNTELIPEEVRTKVKKWSDYIDYWAVDWHFQNDTFMQGWVTYRTRKDRKLALTADPHTYGKAGCYRLLVKVVDIFGNDTS